MTDFLMFVMVCCLFVHTFSNFLLGVYTSIANKLSTTPVADTATTVENFVASVVAGVVSFVKKL